jgi:hypothetical protein
MLNDKIEKESQLDKKKKKKLELTHQICGPDYGTKIIS